MSQPTAGFLQRRCILSAGASLGLSSLSALAQVPASDGAARLFVGFPPGGSGDLFARILADALREELSRPVVVENRPGAGGLTVAVNFLRAPKDGSHLMLATGSTAVSAPISRAKPPYNPIDDFQWVALLTNAPFVIAVNPALPVTDMPGLVAHCKAHAGKLSYGHAGLGTTVHLAAELFKDRAGLQVVDVPYAGSAGAITDTIAGNVQFIVETSGTLLPHHKSGKLRIISCMAEIREKISPDIPTAREAGYDLIAGTSNLLAAPQGTPAEVVEHLARSTVRAMQKPSVQQRLDQLGIQAFAKSSPELARQYVTAEVNRWSAVVKKLGIAL